MNASLVRANDEWITQSKSKQEASARMFTSEAYHNSFWEMSEHGIVIFDENYSIIDANPSFADLVGVPIGELLNRNIFDFVEVSFANHDLINIRALIKGKVTSYEVNEELKYKAQSHRLIPARVIVTRVPKTSDTEFRHAIAQIYLANSHTEIGSKFLQERKNQDLKETIKGLLNQPWFSKGLFWLIGTISVLLALQGNFLKLLEKIVDKI